MTKEEALEIGHQVMKDIGFDWWDKEQGPNVVFIEKEKFDFYNQDVWMVCFPYGKEDYGENDDYMIDVLDIDYKASNISFRNGFIKLGINTSGKYFIVERRP